MLIRTLTNKFHNKPVLVVGSAPNQKVDLAKLPSDVVVVCVKGSAWCAASLDLPSPDVLFQGSWRYLEYAEFCSGLKADTVVHVGDTAQSQENLNELIQSYSDSGLEYNHLYTTTHDAFVSILNTTGIGSNGYKMSFGTSVALLAAALGASEIITTGIDPMSSGHMHPSSYAKLEDHKVADIVVLTQLARVLPLSTFTSNLAVITGARYLND